MHLLSENDLKELRTALAECREVELTRSLHGVTITARTSRAGPPWPVPIILQVRREAGRLTSMQNFVSVDKFVEMWKER